MAEEKAPSWKDFFTLLHYAGGLLYVAFAITLIVILREKEWHPQVVRFMARAWHEFLAHMGSTAAGFVSPIAVSILSIGATIACIGFLYGRAAMKKHIGETAGISVLVFVTIMLLVYGTQFAVEVARVGYHDHEDVVNQINSLHEYANNKQIFDEQLREANQKATFWQNEFESLSHGDIHPDRFLNAEQTNKLFTELDQAVKNERLAKKPDRDFLTVKIGSVQDREAIHLANQILEVFREAHWKVIPIRKLGKQYDTPTYYMGGANGNRSMGYE